MSELMNDAALSKLKHDAQAQAVSGQGPAFLPDFKASTVGTMGIELELMVLDRLTFDLFPAAPDILRLLDKHDKPWVHTPEITTSMLEVATAILTSFDEAAEQLEHIRTTVQRAAFDVGASISGGGAHPFQKWNEQRIYPKERYFASERKFGYLAKLFTVFGMHVHIGAGTPDEAMRLCSWLTQRAPLFIALSANSPCWQGEVSGFCSSRSNVVGAFPMSGILPYEIRTWDDFRAHFDELAGHGIVNSIKDFYWDVRPKPEYGTVEIRVCDTPLTVDRAAHLAAFAQALARWLWSERPALSPDVYLTHSYNRFQASRHGLQGTLVDPVTAASVTLADDLRATLGALAPHAEALGSADALASLRTVVDEDGNDAAWLRARFAHAGTLPDVVRQQAALFMG